MIPAAVAVFALLPAAAQAIPHWTSGMATIANGVKTPVVSWGGATNLSMETIGEVNCKIVGGGFVENIEGKGRGKTQALDYFECKAPACEVQVKEKFGVAGKLLVLTENLPEPDGTGKLGSVGWENELFEGKSATGGETSLRERIGVAWTVFPEGGQVGHESPIGMMRLTVECVLATTGSPVAEATFEGAQEPEIGEAFTENFNGMSAAHPSVVHFASAASGRLHSEAQPEEPQGTFAGNLKYLGYVSQSTIGAVK
jgi:hypothetical protein